MLSREEAVARPDQEAEHERQQRRVEPDDRADHALGLGDVRRGQEPLQAESRERARKRDERHDCRPINENHRRLPPNLTPGATPARKP